MKGSFVSKMRNVSSQLFINLAAGWFGIVFIIPGITQLNNLTDYLWLTRNILFGMLALLVAIILSDKQNYEF